MNQIGLLLEKYLPFITNIRKHWYGHAYALFLINLLWVPFRAKDVNTEIQYISGMFRVQSIDIEKKAIRFLPYIFLVIINYCPWEKVFDKFKELKLYKICRSIILVILFILSLSIQCLSNQRIKDVEHLNELLSSWEVSRNRKQKGIIWYFKTADARTKLYRLYPKPIFDD